MGCRAKAEPRQAELDEYFRFDPETGRLFWKKQTGKKKIVGREAGTIDHRGYRVVKFRSEPYKSHRLIWIINNGAIPNGFQIDHINHDKSDNRLENLRIVTQAENLRNLSKNKHNKSGHTGVCWDKQCRKWKAQIGINGKKKCLGRFDCKLLAAVTRKMAEWKYDYHPNHGASPTKKRASRFSSKRASPKPFKTDKRMAFVLRHWSRSQAAKRSLRDRNRR